MSASNLSYVNNALQTALNSASGLFSTSKVSAATVVKEIDDLSNNLASLNQLLRPDEGFEKQQLSWFGATTSGIPKGISVGVSFSRATSTIKNLSTPISTAEGTAILNSYRILQTRVLAHVKLYEDGASYWEKLTPGIKDFGSRMLKQLFDSLSNALSNADANAIPPATVQEIQGRVTLGIQSLSSAKA